MIVIVIVIIVVIMIMIRIRIRIRTIIIIIIVIIWQVSKENNKVCCTINGTHASVHICDATFVINVRVCSAKVCSQR